MLTIRDPLREGYICLHGFSFSVLLCVQTPNQLIINPTMAFSYKAKILLRTTTALAFEMKCLNDVIFLLLQCLHVFLQLLNVFLGKFCKN